MKNIISKTLIAICISVLLFASACVRNNEEIVLEERSTSLSSNKSDDSEVEENNREEYNIYKEFNNGYKLVYREETLVSADEHYGGKYYGNIYGIVDADNKIIYDIGSVLVANECNEYLVEEFNTIGLLYGKDYYNLESGQKNIVSPNDISIINEDFMLVALPPNTQLTFRLKAPPKEKIISATYGVDRMYYNNIFFSSGLFYLLCFDTESNTYFYGLIDTDGNIVITPEKYTSISWFFDGGTALADWSSFDSTGEIRTDFYDVINTNGEIVSTHEGGSGW